MQVFKTYFKVQRRGINSMLIYVAVFLFLAVVFSANATSAPENFDQASIPIAIINRDGGGLIAEGLSDYLAATNEIKPYPDDPEQLQDALFFRDIGYIVVIPQEFSSTFLATGDSGLQKIIVPGATYSHYIDMQIDRYLNTARLYLQHGGNFSPAEIVAVVRADLAQETEVTVQTFGAANSKQGFVYYFGYLAYALLALVILGVSTSMLTFNQPDLRRRNQCAPIPTRQLQGQLAAGHTIFALSCWFILVAFSFFLYGKELLASGLLGLLCLNALAYTIVCSSIGFVVGSFVKDHNAQAGAVNVLTLGMSFICGVFVPLELLQPSVLAVARFLPTYWYVKANDAIAMLGSMTAEQVQPIVSSMLIQLAFAAAIFSITLFLSKERRMSIS